MENKSLAPSGKETEEETMLRVYDIISQKWYNCPYKELTVHAQRDITVPICKLYASERLRLSMPSEEEIEKLFNKHANRIHSSYMTLRLDNFKKAVSQLFNR